MQDENRSLVGNFTCRSVFVPCRIHVRFSRCDIQHQNVRFLFQLAVDVDCEVGFPGFARRPADQNVGDRPPDKSQQTLLETLCPKKLMTAQKGGDSQVSHTRSAG